MGKQTQQPMTMLSLRLRRARMQSRHPNGRKVSQQDTADIVGVSIATMYRWEAGKRTPRPPEMERLASLLAIDEDEVWLDTYTLKPDMMQFLTTTQEGARVVQNIRTIMTRLETTQTPTRRRGVPEGIHIPIYRHRPVQGRTAKKKTP